MHRRPVRRLSRAVFWLAAGGLVAWVICVAGLLAARHTLIYPFDRAPASPHILPRTEELTFLAADGIELAAWVAPPAEAGAPVIIFFMGNAGNLGRNVPRLREYLLRGFGLVALAYRQGASRPGIARETTLFADALALYDQVDALFGSAVPPDKRVIYGTSLGTGVAMHLAASRPAAGLVLETPFDRLCRVVEDRIPIIPACLLMWDERYDSIERAADISVPTLVLHGDSDQVISLQRSRTLFEALPGPRRMIVYPGGRHNDLRLFGAGIDSIDWIHSLEN